MSFMLTIPVINLAKYQEMVCVKRLEDIVDKKKKNLETSKLIQSPPKYCNIHQTSNTQVLQSRNLTRSTSMCLIIQ